MSYQMVSIRVMKDCMWEPRFCVYQCGGEKSIQGKELIPLANQPFMQELLCYTNRDFYYGILLYGY